MCLLTLVIQSLQLDRMVVSSHRNVELVVRQLKVGIKEIVNVIRYLLWVTGVT